MAQQEYQKLIKNMAMMSGVDELSATIWGILYSEPENVAMEDLAERTGYSLASISNKIRMLEMTGFIKKVRHPGSKKIFVYMEKDLFGMWKTHLVKTQIEKMRYAKQHLPEIIKSYKQKTKTEDQKKRLKIMENHYRQILKFDHIMEKVIAELK